MININTQDLIKVLDLTPDSQNIMLVGKHGIGKSEILTEYFSKKGMKVTALFLGQMSDPGDLIGLPNKDEKTGKTTFMPPYWFPMDGQPIVLFLDELNRARPEVLQTIMDLALNKKLAGRQLPEGSRIISAVNDGQEYQLTDLDPALVSRFNIYGFRPTSEEWLLWAAQSDVDSRVIDFIQENPEYLDGKVSANPAQIDNGLDKSPDRRGWKKVSDIMKGIGNIEDFHKKLISGIVGVQASSKFCNFVSENSIVSAKDVLLKFSKVAPTLEYYQVHQFAQVNESIFRYIETAKKISDKDKELISKNIPDYIDLMLDTKNKESVAHFASLWQNGNYPKAITFIMMNCEAVYGKIMDYIANI